MRRFESLPWLEVLNPGVVLGQVRYALFDFDGTLSLIRRGWEDVMRALMVSCITGGGEPPAEIEAEVAAYIDHSTGILTIKQMKWLAEAVRRYGIAKEVYSPAEYKHLYLERLLTPVRQRLASLDGSQAARDAWMVVGARAFLESLADRQVQLFLASGTDQEYVVTEAAMLDVAHFFGDNIFGAQGDSEEDSKEAVIRRLLQVNRLAGPELLVVGDGPVEISLAHAVGAVALGVAADEQRRQGLDVRKRQRLVGAGADLLITDFLHAQQLAHLLCAPVNHE